MSPKMKLNNTENSTEKMLQVSRVDEIYAAVICFTLSTFGIVTNGTAVAVIASVKNLHNAFGYSCISHAIGDLGVLFVFATWVPFQFILPVESIPAFLQNQRLAYTIGQATIVFYYAAIYTHVLIGVNRYMAIAKPFAYGVYFSESRTMKWIALIWIISFIQSCIYQIDGCHYYFDRSAMLFLYSERQCAQIISLYLEFYVNLGFVILVIILDVLTFCKLKKMTQATHSFDQAGRRRKAQEIRYFIQSVCSETALVLTFLCFWCAAAYARTPFHSFLLNIVSWLSMHAFDGLIMTAFNNQILTRIGRSRRTTKAISAPMVTVVLSATGRTVNNQNLSAEERWLNLYRESKFKSNRIEPLRE